MMTTLTGCLANTPQLCSSPLPSSFRRSNSSVNRYPAGVQLTSLKVIGPIRTQFAGFQAPSTFQLICECQKVTRNFGIHDKRSVKKTVYCLTMRINCLTTWCLYNSIIDTAICTPLLVGISNNTIYKLLVLLLLSSQSSTPSLLLL